jgi:tetratricopeptide (TPR) repeat protein
MKKLLIIFLLAGACISSALSQQWVNFSSSQPKAPELNLITSNAQEVTFEITIPGIYAQDTVVGGTAFNRLNLPGGCAINPIGYPELSVLSYKVAIPSCEDVVVAFQINSTQTMPSCWVYPMPEMVLDGNGMLVEQFAFEPTAYAQLRTIEPAAIISSSGALREQRYVEVTFLPVEFCPVTRQLSVIDKIEVNLTFTNPQGELRQNTGIFNKVAASAFINYADDGKSALTNDKAFEKEGFTPGNVQWITLTDTAQAVTIPGDYLIITHSLFFNSQNSDIQRLAEHRAFYNGFDVSIVNVDHIWALPFYYEGTFEDPSDPEYIKEQKLRTFIRRVFEGQNASNPNGDGHLAYVLLVGDYENGVGIPGALDHDAWTSGLIGYGEKYPSDYYYSCITKDAAGQYDVFGDLYLGRFSVEDTVQLYNIVQKTLNHETEYSPQFWRETAGFTNIITGYGYERYLDFLNDIMSNSGWNYSIVESYYDIKIPTITYLNAGVSFVQYKGVPNYTPPYSWDNDLNTYFFSSELNNDYKVPFISCVSSNTGWFDDMECMAEFLTRYSPTKGAVGYIGPTREIFLQISDTILLYQEAVLDFLYKEKISIVGELLLTTKNLDKSETPWDFPFERKHAYNLFGDPSLNILAEGYEITRDVTAECPARITCPVRIHNGATLTVPANCNLSFLEDGKLTIDANGSMVIEENAIVFGVNNDRDSVIHVKGGGFTLGNDVVFTDLPGGVLLENIPVNSWSIDPNKLYLHVKSKEYVINNATFNNSPLLHNQTVLNISNTTFNDVSDVTTFRGIVKIDSCNFIHSTFKSDHAMMMDKIYEPTIVTNCLFTGNNYSSSVAIMLNSSKMLHVANNTITGYEMGISLSNSGFSLVYPPSGGSRIGLCNISNCGIGIELYGSAAGFSGNIISNNIHGVRLLNGTYSNFTQVQNSPPQIIQDCESFEIYASSNSFPTYFHYNSIIDDNNGGNSVGDPLFYWDTKSVFGIFPQDVTYNCWGENFDPKKDLYPYENFICYPTMICGKSGSSGSPTPGVAETLYQSGLTYFAEDDYPNAEATFKELIETYPESHFSIAAMHELFALEHYTNQNFYQLNSYFASITPSDSNLFDVADFLATRCNVKMKEWQPAIDWYEERIENPPSYQDSVFAVIDLGDIHLMMEADTIGGSKSGSAHYRLTEIKPASKQAFEENRAILLATLPQTTHRPPQTDNPQTSNRTPHTSKGVLGECVPNPTNGNTTIYYEIYADGLVELNIYNTMGQLVQHLPQGTLTAGKYNTTVSVVGMPAGVYHYSLVVNGERTDSKKLVVN